MKDIGSKNIKTWIEIDSGAIKKNYQTFRSLISKDCKLMVVVKSNAYGHGIVQFAKEIEDLRADFLGVDDIGEAFELRVSAIQTPLLVFGYIPPSFYERAEGLNISLTISNFESLSQLKKHPNLKVHIQADTGLGRQGFLSKRIQKVLKFLQENNIEPEGLYTHFAVAENPEQLDFTKGQIKEFKKWIVAFKEAGFEPIVHASASAETMRSSLFHFDMVRIGISIYGLWPSEEIRREVEGKIKLYPALAWKSVVSEVKELPKGYNIGYDLTETLKKDSIVAILPIGYWHGYPRYLSGKGEVAVRGKKARILGRVSMDMIVIDVSDVPGIEAGEEVFIIGGDEKAYISASDLAEKADTINYEIVTRINPLIKRIYK